MPLQDRESTGESAHERLGIGSIFDCKNIPSFVSKERFEDKHARLVKYLERPLSLEGDLQKDVMVVRSENRVLGTVPYPHSASDLWKGDLLTVLQENTRSLLLDHITGEDYDRGFALESHMFEHGSLLPRLNHVLADTPEHAAEVIDAVKKTLKIPPTDEISVSTAPRRDRHGIAITQILLSSKKNPGKIYTAFELGKRDLAGPDADVIRVRSMNVHPVPEELPTPALISLLQSQAKDKSALTKPSVRLRREGQKSILELHDVDKEKDRIVATMTFNETDGRTPEK